MSLNYNPPLALTVIASIFIGLAGLVSIWITWDILWRRGWRSMMTVMIPVYILNALYLAPITLWTYLKYGRPMTSPTLREWIKEHGSSASDMAGHDMSGHMHMMHGDGMPAEVKTDREVPLHEGHRHHDMEMESGGMVTHSHVNHDTHAHQMGMEKEMENGNVVPKQNYEMSGHDYMHHEPPTHNSSADKEMSGGKASIGHQHDGHPMAAHDHTAHKNMKSAKGAPAHNHAGHNMPHMQHGGGGGHYMSHMKPGMMSDPTMYNMMRDRPMFATVTVAVCHCGAGCLLGDIVGEWLVYGTNAQINGRGIWPEFLIDYAFALLIGIVFQYFSIAPMSGEHGPKTIYRAVKADFLSLTFFEIGLFGWMAVFQIAIFDWKLQTNNVVYWWMMQIGMFLGHWTAFPINWWLITSGIKEPCA